MHSTFTVEAKRVWALKRCLNRVLRQLGFPIAAPLQNARKQGLVPAAASASFIQEPLTRVGPAEVQQILVGASILKQRIQGKKKPLPPVLMPATRLRLSVRCNLP